MVDVILCPAGPGVAPHFNTAKYWNYTSQWNLLDYPALVFPVTRVDPEKDAVGKDSPPFSPMSERDKESWALYEGGPESFRDAPVGLQLVGRRFDDEKVSVCFRIFRLYYGWYGGDVTDDVVKLLAVMGRIERAIGLPFVK